MEFEKVLSLFKQFIRGKLGVISFLLVLFVLIIVWLFSTSLSGIVQDKAILFFNSYIVELLSRRWLPPWVLCISVPIILLIALLIGIRVGQKNPLKPPQKITNDEANSNVSLNERSLFQDLITEVKENPNGLPHGKVWGLLYQVSNDEMSEQEYAAQIVTMLNKNEINEKMARKFLSRYSFILRRRNDEYFYIRKA